MIPMFERRSALSGFGFYSAFEILDEAHALYWRIIRGMTEEYSYGAGGIKSLSYAIQF